MRKVNGNLMLKPPPRLGDTVLLEPLLRSYLSAGQLAFASSPYAEIFSQQNWPTHTDDKPDIYIDLTGPWEDGNRVLQYYQKATKEGYKVDLLTQLPRLDNIEPVEIENEAPKIGLVHSAQDGYKVWPYWKVLARALSSRNRYDVYAFDKRLSLKYAQNKVGLSLLDLMKWLKAMDLVVANDTGPAHVAAAMGVPLLVLSGQNDCRELYECYAEIVTLLESPNKHLACLSARSVLKEAVRVIRTPYVDLPDHGGPLKRIVLRKHQDIALMRMDGLGGTVTLLDQAKKVKEKTGQKVVLLTRGFEPLLESHPAVKEVRRLGGLDWFDALEVLRNTYYALADVRLAVGKWYGRGYKMFPDAWLELDNYYYYFPFRLAELERYRQHQVCVADRTLGLPADTIESFTYADDGRVKDWFNKPYILIAPGSDAWHLGRGQVKLWASWEEIVPLLPLQAVQVGTRYDQYVPGAVDLRGKTSLLELAGLIRRSKVVLCIEGGIMHLAYACKHPKTVVLRGPTTGKLFEYPGQVQIDSYACSGCWSMSEDWLWACSKGIDALCMKSISADRVLYHIERLVA